MLRNLHVKNLALIDEVEVGVFGDRVGVEGTGAVAEGLHQPLEGVAGAAGREIFAEVKLQPPLHAV